MVSPEKSTENKACWDFAAVVWSCKAGLLQGLRDLLARAINKVR